MAKSDSNSLFLEAFFPKDQLLVKFLQDRIVGQLEIPIKEVEVFGNLSPHEIYSRAEFQERASNGPDESTFRYCFTTLKKTTQGGQRYVRTTGGGTWKLQANKVIKVDEKPIARMRSFTYYPRKSGSTGPVEPDREYWVMHEFTLINPPLLEGNNNQDVAICKIRKRLPYKREREQDEQAILTRDAKKMRSSTSSSTNDSENSINLQQEEQPCHLNSDDSESPDVWIDLEMLLSDIPSMPVSIESCFT